MDFEKEFEAIVASNATKRIDAEPPVFKVLEEQKHAKYNRLNIFFLLTLVSAPTLSFFISRALGASSGYPTLIAFLTFVICFIFCLVLYTRFSNLSNDLFDRAQKNYLRDVVTPWVEEFYGLSYTNEEIYAMFYSPNGIAIPSSRSRMRIYDINGQLSVGALVEFKPSSLQESLKVEKYEED